MKQVLIVGAGSVGGYFGAHLARASDAVSFLLRRGSFEAVSEHGLIVRSPGGSLTVRPRIASDCRALPAPDVIVLAMKAYDLDQALNDIEPVLTPSTVILTLQNGVDTEARVTSRIGRDCVIGGVAYISSRLAAPGIIDHFRRGSIAIGEVTGTSSPRIRAIVDLFTQAGLTCHISGDLIRTKWEKMCWNCVFNPLTVLFDGDIGAVMELHRRPLLEMIVAEVTAVAAASGVPLGPNMSQRVVQWTEDLRDLRTSMYEDWRSGRPTEIDHLNGFIAARGRTLGLQTPANDLIASAVRTLTKATLIHTSPRSR